MKKTWFMIPVFALFFTLIACHTETPVTTDVLARPDAGGTRNPSTGDASEGGGHPTAPRDLDLKPVVSLGGPGHQGLAAAAQGPRFALVTLANKSPYEAQQLRVSYAFEEGLRLEASDPTWLGDSSYRFCAVEKDITLLPGDFCVVMIEAQPQTHWVDPEAAPRGVISFYREGRAYAEVSLANVGHIYAGGVSQKGQGYFAFWDGQNWATQESPGAISALTTNVQGVVYATAEDGTNTGTRTALRVWREGRWSEPLSQWNGEVNALYQDAQEGRLYAAGSFAPIDPTQPSTAHVAWTPLATPGSAWQGINDQVFPQRVNTLSKAHAVLAKTTPAGLRLQALDQDAPAYTVQKRPLLKIFQITNSSEQRLENLRLDLTDAAFSYSFREQDYNADQFSLCQQAGEAAFALAPRSSCLVVVQTQSVAANAQPGAYGQGRLTLTQGGEVVAAATLVQSQNLYAAGTFSALCRDAACGQTGAAHKVARYDGHRWQPLESGASALKPTTAPVPVGEESDQNAALALMVEPSSGRLYIGGGLVADVQGQAVSHLFRWDGGLTNGYAALEGSRGVDNTVYSLTYDPTQLQMIVGGRFTNLSRPDGSLQEFWKMASYNFNSGLWGHLDNFKGHFAFANGDTDHIRTSQTQDAVRDVLWNVRPGETYVAGNFTLRRAYQSPAPIPLMSHTAFLLKDHLWSDFLFTLDSDFCNSLNYGCVSFASQSPYPKAYSIASIPYGVAEDTPHVFLSVHGLFTFALNQMNAFNMGQYLSWNQKRIVQGDSINNFQRPYLQFSDGNQVVYDAVGYSLAGDGSASYTMHVGSFTQAAINRSTTNADGFEPVAGVSNLLLVRLMGPAEVQNPTHARSHYLGNCYSEVKSPYYGYTWPNPTCAASTANDGYRTFGGGLEGGPAKAVLRVPGAAGEHGTFFVAGGFTQASGNPAYRVAMVQPDQSETIVPVGYGIADGEVRALALGTSLEVEVNFSQALEVALQPYVPAANAGDYYIDGKTRGPLFRVFSVRNASSDVLQVHGELTPNAGMILEEDPQYAGPHTLCHRGQNLAPAAECVVIVRGSTSAPVGTISAALEIYLKNNRYVSIPLEHKSWLAAGGAFTTLPKRAGEEEASTFLTALFDGQNWTTVRPPAGESLQNANASVMQLRAGALGGLVVAGNYHTKSLMAFSGWYPADTETQAWDSLGRYGGYGLQSGYVRVAAPLATDAQGTTTWALGGAFQAKTTSDYLAPNFGVYVTRPKNEWYSAAHPPMDEILALVQVSPEDPTIYLGGRFTGLPANYVARWQHSTSGLSTWTALGQESLPGPVRALTFGQTLKITSCLVEEDCS